MIYDGFHGDRRDIRKVDTINTYIRGNHVKRTLFHLLCARKLPVLRDLWRREGARCSCSKHRVFRGFSSSSTSSSSSYSVLVAVSPWSILRMQRVLQFPRARRGLRSLFVSLSPSLSLSISLAFCLLLWREHSLARPSADANHTARYARLSMRRTAHASRLRTPTDAARGALTSPAATRKSGRNTGSMKPLRPARWSRKARRCKTPQDPWILSKLTMPAIIVRTLECDAKLQ